MGFRLEMPETEELIQVGLIAAGSGVKGTVAGFVQKVAPDMDVDTAGIIGGALMYLFGGQLHPYVKFLGVGVLAGSIAPKIEELIPKQGGGGGGGGGSPPATTDTLAALAQAEANIKAVYS